MILESAKDRAWQTVGYELSCGCFAFANSRFLNRFANHVHCRNCNGRYFIIKTVYQRNG